MCEAFEPTYSARLPLGWIEYRRVIQELSDIARPPLSLAVKLGFGCIGFSTLPLFLGLLIFMVHRLVVRISASWLGMCRQCLAVISGEKDAKALVMWVRAAGQEMAGGQNKYRAQKNIPRN